ncbi:Ribosomal RNA-processing protein 7 [Spathaspora sp. JA1]|nr:Ribosomal RNA-processing protein 7 [Spathaspora sp. JA1]
MAPTEIKGYHILPISIPTSNSHHYLYFKKHDNKQNPTVSNRSIFIFNLPISTTINIVKKYFQDVAIGATVETYTPSLLTDHLEDIWIDLTKLTSDLELTNGSSEEEGGLKLPKNCGIVTFIDKASFQLAFNALKKLSSNETVSNWPVISFDSNYYLSKYQQQILNIEELSTFISESLIHFDQIERESKESLQQQTELVDEDGFTLVVGSHRKTKAGIMGKQKLASTVEVDKAKTKLKKKEKEDFYRFQLRQRKKEEMNELLTKFKSDQERVRLMKEKKRFRPY